MAHELLTIGMITNESLMVLENQLVIAMKVRRDFDDKFGIEGAQIGDTLKIRKPPRYAGRQGAVMAEEDAKEEFVSLVLSEQFGQDTAFTAKERTLDISSFSSRFLKPAVASIANQIDTYVAGLQQETANYVGTPGTLPSTWKTYLQAGQKLNEESAPMDGDRCMVLTPRQEVEIVDSLKTLFQASAEIAAQYRNGMMGRTAGFDWYMSQNLDVHTVGTILGYPASVDGSTQSGNSITIDGFSTSSDGVLLKGDSIEFAGVFAVNKQNRKTTGSLRQFVVTEDGDSDGSGEVDVKISPALIATGAQQTVTALPADNAAVTVFNHASNHRGKATQVGMAFHRDAYALGSADLYLPEKGTIEANYASDNQLGFSIRFIQDWDTRNDKLLSRFDVLIGRTALYQELGCKVMT